MKADCLNIKEINYSDLLFGLRTNFPVLSLFFCFLAIVKFELRALHLLAIYFTT
jgi:hypothetical protein